jgi:hypothetical protein
MQQAPVNIPCGMILLISLGFTSAAHAAAITNLDDKSQMIEVKRGAHYVAQEIRAGETWRTAGDVTVRFAGSESRIEDKQEFTIWKGGAFGPQKVLDKKL